MARAIAIITDDPRRSGDLTQAIPKPADITMVELGPAMSTASSACEIVIVDVPLSDPSSVSLLRHQLAKISPVAKKLFIVAEIGRQEHVQANFLGATEAVPRSGFSRCLGKHIGKADRKLDMEMAVDVSEKLNEDLFAAAQRGQRLPLHEIEHCADLIEHSLRRAGIAAWLDEVKSHHSYTHRHSMHVTGLAVAFGIHHGMRSLDLQRIATGAMLHDIGKARIPIEILDKPTRLSSVERMQIRQHADFSGDVLELDGQFDAEVIDVARHHHEYLDGSGYPDGLAGGEISDLVRIVAIADVYSALIDRRAYKPAIAREKAFSMLLRMGDKLDASLVSAFEPLALNTL